MENSSTRQLRWFKVHRNVFFRRNFNAPKMETAGKEVEKDETQDYFVNGDGQRIFCKYWYPEGALKDQLRAIVFICHGAAEHCQAYEKLAGALTKQGLLAFGHDHVGHGKSEGDRVHMETFDTYENDVIRHIDIVKRKHPELPCYIIGHSMGGTIAVKTALDHPELFAGVVLISPAIVIDRTTATPFKVFVAKVLANLMPQFQVGALQPDWISRDPDIVKKYAEDPLVWHGGLKARFSVIMMNVMEEIQSRVSEMKVPFFILHGSADKLCKLEGSQLLCDQASSKVKSLKVFEGAYHQVHNEPNGQGDEAIADIVDWITRV